MSKRWLSAVAAAVIAAVGITACGGSSSSDGGAAGSTGSSTGALPSFAKVPYVAPKTGCGSYDTPAPKDPEGALSEIPASARANYGAYNVASSTGEDSNFVKSAWANWKPDHAPPYKVAISWGQLVSDWQVQMTTLLKQQLEASPLVGKGNVEMATTGSNLDTGQQLQQFNAMVDRHPDLIIAQVLSPGAFRDSVDRAGKMGIPTVFVQGVLTDQYSVGVDGNNYLNAADVASYMAQAAGGKGTWLNVLALAGSSIDQLTQMAVESVVENCPGMEIGKDAAYGGFSDAQAKSETLKYLATHPGKIDLVMQTAAMAPGVMKAFEQSGRPMPIVADVGLSKGSMGYFREHQAGGYHSAGGSVNPAPFSRATTEVSLRILQGQGPKINAIVDRIPSVNDANIQQDADPAWKLETPGVYVGTRDEFLTAKYLDQFFNKPGPAQFK